MTFQIRNKIDAPCIVCGTRVARMCGLSSKTGTKWFTVCMSAHCIKTKGLKTVEEQPKTEANIVRNVEGDKFIVTFGYSPEAVALVKGMYGARWNHVEKHWMVDAGPEHYPRITEVMTKLGVSEERLNEVLGSGMTKSQKADAEAIEAVLKVSSARGAYPYQLEGIRFLYGMDRALLGDDMGLGKTVQCLLSMPKGTRAVVVCPKSVMTNWEREARIWAPHMTCRYGVDNLFKAPKENEIVIVNYNTISSESYSIIQARKKEKKEAKKAGRRPAPIASFEWDKSFEGITLVADEGHYLKNKDSARHDAFKSLSSIAGKTWILTGTPLANRPPDLWGVLASGQMEKAVFGSYSGFMKCFGAYKGKFGIIWNDPLPEVPERLRRVMLRRHKSEVLPDLPRKTYTTIEVPCGQVVELLLNELQDEWGDVVEAGELPPFEEFSKVRSLLALDRIPAMLELIEEYEENEEPLVVFSAHRAPIDALKDRAGWVVITGDTSAQKRGEAVEAFQAGQCKGIALTIAAGGTGVTLTRASHMLFVDKAWRPCDNAQAEDRICRIGQAANACNILSFVGDHPLDVHTSDLLIEKQRIIEGAVEKLVAAPVSPEQPLAATVSESVEEWEARVAAFEQAQQEDADRVSRSKFEEAIDRILRKQSERATAPELELTNEVCLNLVEAHRYMLSVCDGALEDDGKGFNKPDSFIARILEVDFNDDRSMRALERMLSRYHRQLGERFPVLFPSR